MKSNTHKIMTIAVLWFRLYLHVQLEKQATLYLCLTELKRCSSLPCAEQKLSRRINALSHNKSCLILLSIKSPWFYIPLISIGLQFSGVSKKSVHAKQLKKALTSKRFGPTSKAAEWNCFQSDPLTERVDRYLLKLFKLAGAFKIQETKLKFDSHHDAQLELLLKSFLKSFSQVTD